MSRRLPLRFRSGGFQGIRGKAWTRGVQRRGFMKTARYFASRRGPVRARFGFNRTGGYYGRYSGRRAELKFHDIDINSTNPIPTAGEILAANASLNVIAQGNTESQRIGRKLTIKSILWRMKFRILANTAASTTEDSVRIILYLDKQCNGAAAVVTDILETASFLSFNHLANSSRFVILMDKHIQLNQMAGGGDGTTEDYGAKGTRVQFFKKCNIKIEYDDSATTGVLTSCRSNNLGVLFISSAAQCDCVSKMRLRYSDQ